MFAFALGLPLLTLVWQSFFRNLAQPFFSSAAQATLENYDFILRYPIFLAAVKTSVLLAAMAATIVAGLTFVMCVCSLRAVCFNCEAFAKSCRLGKVAPAGKRL